MTITGLVTTDGTVFEIADTEDVKLTVNSVKFALISGTEKTSSGGITYAGITASLFKLAGSNSELELNGVVVDGTIDTDTYNAVDMATCSVIDASAGTLTLTSCEFKALTHATLELIKLGTGATLVMTPKTAAAEEEPAVEPTETSMRRNGGEVAPTTFTGIERKAGGGSVFDVSLSGEATLTIQNADFTTCTCTGTGAPGGAIKITNAGTGTVTLQDVTLKTYVR